MDMSDLNRYLDDRPEASVFRVHGDAFTDNELLDLEFRHIFEKTWIFLTLESSIARANDYVTTRIGRTPVLVTRNASGGIGAFVNACRHKGATVARLEQGNARYHVCPYHGWAYDASGRNVDIKDRKAGCYAPAFDADNHDLLPLAKLASYKGLVFGSLSADAAGWLSSTETTTSSPDPPGASPTLISEPGRLAISSRRSTSIAAPSAKPPMLVHVRRLRRASPG